MKNGGASRVLLPVKIPRFPFLHKMRFADVASVRAQTTDRTSKSGRISTRIQNRDCSRPSVSLCIESVLYFVYGENPLD